MAQSQYIFYSWQSDSPKSVNRNFIEDCLQRAIKVLSREDLTEVLIDRDTQGISGMPDIGQAILEKIRKSSLVVADLTIINPQSVRRPNERPVSNPNVLFELGYAFGTRGERAMIGVFNTAFGDVEELPFDLRPKRLLTYHLEPHTDKTATRDGVVRSMVTAIRAGLGDTTEEVTARNSLISDTSRQIRMIGTEIDEWPMSQITDSLLEDVLDIGEKMFDAVKESGWSSGLQNIANSIVGHLRKAHQLEINIDNWPDIQNEVREAGEMVEMLTELVGFTLDTNSHDRMIEWWTRVPARIDSFIALARSGNLKFTDFDTFTQKARDHSLLNLMPSNPSFTKSLSELTLDMRRLLHKWHRAQESADEVIVQLGEIKERMMSILTRFSLPIVESTGEPIEDESPSEP